jgi:hypothetical protein
VNEEYSQIGIPDILFQYCSESAIDIFENRRIKSSTPSTLNDPFEWKPSVDEEVTPDQIWDTMVTLHKKRPLHVPPNRTVVARMKAEVPDAAKRHQDQFGSDLEKHTRIICLSQRNDGILMWAHYADRHKGFVVGFNSDLLRRNHSHSGFYKVSYNLERPVVPHPYVAPPDKNQLIPAVSQKSPEWAYEEEWRLLVHMSHLRRDRDLGNPNMYLPILPNAIDQVIFGSRCSDTLVSKIDAVLNSTPELKGVRRFRAHLDPKLFRILVEKF